MVFNWDKVPEVTGHSEVGRDPVSPLTERSMFKSLRAVASSKVGQ